ncbi:MAG: hypothetical protein WDN27_02840 [Candidatus Saccharibacteria bacterium]
MSSVSHDQCPFIAPSLDRISDEGEELAQRELDHQEALNRRGNARIEIAHDQEILELIQQGTDSTSTEAQLFQSAFTASAKMLDTNKQQFDAAYKDTKAAIEGNIAANQELVAVICAGCAGEPRRFLGRLICNSSNISLTKRIIKGFPKGEK